jgi:hypothetical protein
VQFIRRLSLAAEMERVEEPVRVEWEEQYMFDQLEQ